MLAHQERQLSAARCRQKVGCVRKIELAGEPPSGDFTATFARQTTCEPWPAGAGEIDCPKDSPQGEMSESEGVQQIIVVDTSE